MNENKEIFKFSDLVDSDVVLDGQSIQIVNVFDKPIILSGIYIAPSKKHQGEEMAKLQFYFADDENKTLRVMFTGSTVLIAQSKAMLKSLSDIENYRVKTTIKKVGNCYKFI